MNKEQQVQNTRVIYLANKANMPLSSGQQITLSELIYLGDSLTNQRQSGVTTLLAFMIIERALSDNDKKILIVSNSLQMAKYNLDLVLELIEKIKNSGFKIDYRFERGKRSIKFTNGSLIMLGNSYIESNLYDTMFIDNATYLHKNVLLSILQSFNSGNKTLYMASNVDNIEKG